MKDDLLAPLLDSICKGVSDILGDNLVGIYLHGSLATQSFSLERSDVDFLVVVSHPLLQEEKVALIRLLRDGLPQAPPKGLEMSIVLKSAVKPHHFPISYELHFSKMHMQVMQDDIEAYCRTMNGKDEDLTAHILLLWHRGQVLSGLPIKEVFEEPARSDYLKSIWFDLADSEEKVEEQPVDTLLNLCRTLAYLEENTLLSKKEGGEWGRTVCGKEYQPLLEQVLSVYEGRQDSERLDQQLAKQFVAEQIRQIGEKMK